MTVGDRTTFTEMAMKFPVRTGMFTLVPVLIALSQLANSYFNGGSLVFTAWFSMAIVMYAILINRYHLAAFRRMELTAPRR